MNNKYADYEFSVFGRVDLDALYDEWSHEMPTESYDEPLCGWTLKYSYAFAKHICALLFENEAENGVTYYRVNVYKGEDDSFKVAKKVRFRETGGFKVKAIGVNKKLTALFVRRANEEIKRDFYYIAIGEKEVVFKNTAEMEYAAICRSLKRVPLVDEKNVLFLHVPENSRFYMSLKDDPKDLVFGELKDDDDDDDKDDDTDDEEDEEDGDDTRCHVEPQEQNPSPEKTAVDELHEMIGLNSIKERVDEIIAFAKVQKLAKEHGKMIRGVNLNLSFQGNPGTAKTTVARIFARIMKENGILSKGGLIEVGRSELVAKYTGQTAIKVKEVFEKAKGNILFIDEAYSLVDDWENEYGDEAIATIVQEMENNRDDMIVIFAGYPEKMETFLSRNPGLRSRVPFVVQFRDYTADELTAIAKSEAARRGYAVTVAAEKKIRVICSNALKTEEFGNGRFSRNLVEAAVMRAASRMVSAGQIDADINTIFILDEEDFTTPDNLKTEKKHVLGFNAA